jgi:hypothetical protein
MHDSTESGIEWCELSQGIVCFCEQIYDVSETKCPDLGDWSEVPHDELDSVDPELISLTDYFDFDLCQSIIKRFSIDLDRDRLLSYIED